MKRKIKAIIAWTVVISLMIGIFCFSSQTADISSKTSRGFSHALFSLMPWYNALGEIEQSQVLENFQFVMRKTAHYFVYALLGASMYLALKETINKKGMYIYAFFISALYAVSDEIHQGFVPGRSCEVRDVFLDSLGVLTGILVVMLIYNLLTIKGKKNII